MTLESVSTSICENLSTLFIHDPSQLLSDQTSEQRIAEIVRKSSENLSSDLRKRVWSEFFDVGPLEALLNDQSITEVMITGSTSIYFERSGKLAKHEDRFLSDLSFRNFVQRVCREANVIPTLDAPFVDGTWRNWRLHMAIPPSVPSPTLTLRRHPDNPWTLSDLQNAGWASQDAIDYLRALVIERKNFLIIGATGSGKTSVLNACLQQTELNERSILIEDTSELRIPNSVSTKLLTRRDPHRILRDIDQSELLKQSLRMRPDRLVMGEIRGGEAKDLLMAFATGHSGCMGTLHAENARQALIRLEMLIQVGAAQWSLQAVRTLVLLSIQAIVVVKKDADGKRKLDGIYKIASLEEVGFLLERVFFETKN